MNDSDKQTMRFLLPNLEAEARLASRVPGHRNIPLTAREIEIIVDALRFRAASQPTDDSTLEPGEEWCMNVAGVMVRRDEWEPGAVKRRATDNGSAKP